MKKTVFEIISPLLSMVLFIMVLFLVEIATTLQNPRADSIPNLIRPRLEIVVINQSQTWYGDFIVNDTDTVIIESCNFTVQDGDIYIYGDLIVNNSTISLRRNTLFKYIWVYGNLTFNGSATDGQCLISCKQGSQTKIYDSNVRGISWYSAEVYICNSTVSQARGRYGCPAIIENSEVTYSGVYLLPETCFSMVNSDVTAFFDVYIGDNLPASIRNLEVQPGHLEKWKVSDPEMGTNITIRNSFMNKWRLIISNWDPPEPPPFALVNSSVEWMHLVAGNTPSQSYTLRLETGMIRYQNIYIDSNFNVTIMNSTINNWSFSPRGGTYRFIDSNFSSMCCYNSDISIENSTMTYLVTRCFYGNLTISNVTTNAFKLGINSGSMDLVLNEGYQDFLNFYNEDQGFNITIETSEVKHWGVETFGNPTVNIFNSTISAMHPDVLFAGLNILGNSTVNIYNSNLYASRCAEFSSLVLVNSTMGILYAYENSNFTAINSVIETIITDPPYIKLVNSTLISAVYLPLALDSNYLTSSIEDDCDTPLPSQFKRVSKYLKLISTYEDYCEAQVRIYYDENELNRLGISETDIAMYYLNEKTSQWCPCSKQGVNVTYNYIWANVTNFSWFVVANRTLMHDVSVLDLTSSKTLVGQGYTLNINVTLKNLGDYLETFNVTLYANTTIIQTKQIILSSGNSTTITFTWNTTDFAKGNYTISAYIEPVLGETHTENNILIDGVVWVNWLYDNTGDGYCGIDDIVAVAEHFGTEAGGPPNSNGFYYHPIYDITCDDYIGIDDVVEIAEHFGEEEPP